MGTTYVKYPWSVNQGDTIDLDHHQDGQKLYTTVKEWCNDHAKGEFKIDPTIYAKGIKVQFSNTTDTKRLKAYIDGVRAFS